jgi:hypothetical protein
MGCTEWVASEPTPSRLKDVCSAIATSRSAPGNNTRQTRTCFIGAVLDQLVKLIGIDSTRNRADPALESADPQPAWKYPGIVQADSAGEELGPEVVRDLRYVMIVGVERYSRGRWAEEGGAGEVSEQLSRLCLLTVTP